MDSMTRTTVLRVVLVVATTRQLIEGNEYY